MPAWKSYPLNPKDTVADMKVSKGSYAVVVASLAATAVVMALLSGASDRHVDGIEPTSTEALSRQVDPTDLVSVPDSEDAAERSLSPEQEVMEMDKESQARADWGHPDYGDFPSQQRLDSALIARASVAISKGKDPEERLESFTRAQSFWLSSGGHVHLMPLEDLGATRPLTGEETQVLNDAVAPFDARIREECVFARDQFQLAAEEYVYRRLKKVPRGDSYEPDYGEKGELRGRYTAFTRMSKGVWTYVIDFRSHDFPALEDSLASLEAMRAERRASAEAIVGQFMN